MFIRLPVYEARFGINNVFIRLSAYGAFSAFEIDNVFISLPACGEFSAFRVQNALKNFFSLRVTYFHKCSILRLNDNI